MKTFIFDLYNTLIDVHTDERRECAWARTAAFFAERGIKADGKRLCAEFYKYVKLLTERALAEKRVQYPEVDWVSAFECMARGLGGKLSRGEAQTALCMMREDSTERMRLFDGTAELLDGLRARGAKLYLLTNAQAAFTYTEMGRFGLLTAFDGALLSSECGVCKPDPLFFEMLFDEYCIDRADAVMVGDDRINDVYGAERVGLSAVWAPDGAAKAAQELFALAEKR